MVKRIAALLLLSALLLISIPFTASAATVSTYASSVNGTRYADYLVVYTNSGRYTGTNDYGYEVVVTDGVVTKVGGNNNYIPSNGMVLSGHGASETWLRENITLGMKVTFNRYSYLITVTSDADTVKYVVTTARNSALEAKSYAENACLVYDETADALFAAAEARYNALTSSSSESELKDLAQKYTDLVSLYREREVSETRGLWLRPKQTSAAEVETYVRQCYENGINMISIETMYDAMMICPMPSDSLFEHNPYFNGFDVLGAFSNSCKRYGIELHLWMPVFFTGFNNGSYYPRNPAYKKPEWQLKTNNGNITYTGESIGMVFLNPALPEVQEFLLETYTYILNTYDVDGFQLDYIRYRDRTATEDYGYDSATIAAFKAAYPQYRNYNITYSTNSYYWNDWVAFRAGKVTEFVKKMRDLIDEIAPEVILSADVSYDYSHSYGTLYQDSKTWMQNNWLDMIHPMAYGEDLYKSMDFFFQYADAGCQVVPGLGIFMDDFGAQEMILQVRQMVDTGCNGVVFFESESFFSKKTGEALTSTLYTEHALAPTKNDANTVNAVLERMVQRLENAYLAGKITWQAWNDLTWSVNSVREALLNSNANSVASDVNYIGTNVEKYVPSGDLQNRLLFDVEIAYAAALRDQGVSTVTDEEFMDGDIPADAVGATQLVIDKVNGKMTGEDSSVFDNMSGNYNLNYSYVMLLKPVEGATNVYTLVEAHENVGTVKKFSTTITEGMIYAAFHSDGVGDGLARKILAKSIAIGTQLTLFGVDFETNGFTSLSPMLYISTAPTCQHTYHSVVTAPTCIKGGYTTYTCIECGDRYVDDHCYPDSNAHTPGEGATCTSAQTCLDCGATIAPKLEHSYTSVVTKPTCTAGGYTTYTCSECGDSYVGDETDVAAHNYNATVTAPTCTKQGYTTFTCKVCGDSYIGDETDVDSNAHNPGEAATCTRAQTCLDCGATIKAKLDHVYNTAVTDPTCEDKGYTTYSCKNCSHSYVDDYVDALGHDYDDVVTDPTCVDKGYTTHTCSVCGDEYVDTYVDALGHDYDDVVTEPTCVDKGYTTHTCSVCGDEYVDSYVDAHGHTPGEWVTLPNKSQEQRCTICNELLDTKPYVPETDYDVNGDGKVNIFDYIAVKAHCLGTNKLTGDMLKRADVNADGKVNLFDYVAIKSYVMS